jgi:leucyl aminopeptidase
MLNSKFLSLKKFSAIAKVKFEKKLSNVKNYMYFLSEKDFENKTNPYVQYFSKNEPTRLNDIKKQKYGIIYPFNKDLFFSERMCIVSTPFELDKTRSVVSSAFKCLSSSGLQQVHVGFSNTLPFHHRRIILTSLIMSNYSFKILGDVKEEDKPESESKKQSYITEICIDLQNDPLNLNKTDSLTLWVNMANATLFTRNLANKRPNVADCDFLEESARKIFETNFPNLKEKISIEVITGDELLKKNLNLIHAVGKSAESAPRIIILKYLGGAGDNISHAIVGKGLTFDTGGLNLKPTNYIEDMYLDKHGACNTLSVFKTVVEMELPINLVCAIGAAENSIDSLSYKPSDIIKSHKGYTVEITNTDAEGRLVLADVLSYVQENYKPEHIIDLATLTGACMVALGNKTAGLFTNDEKFSSDLVRASEEVLEPVWHLPINNEHREDIKSSFADMKNAGKDRYGGASKGAAFLEKFINKHVKWIHLDIAG